MKTFPSNSNSGKFRWGCLFVNLDRFTPESKSNRQPYVVFLDVTNRSVERPMQEPRAVMGKTLFGIHGLQVMPKGSDVNQNHHGTCTVCI